MTVKVRPFTKKELHAIEVALRIRIEAADEKDDYKYARHYRNPYHKVIALLNQMEKKGKKK